MKKAFAIFRNSQAGKMLRCGIEQARYTVCLGFILVLGFITLPLTLFFQWDNIFILDIVNRKRCSFAEAKRLLKEDERYKIRPMSSLGDEDSLSSARDFDEQVTSQAYRHLPSNIHHRY
jgi:hypothetical protein